MTSSLALATTGESEELASMSASPNASTPVATTASTSEGGGEGGSSSSTSAGQLFKYQCHHCLIKFPNQTLYFLHRGFHSDGLDPWKCNGCGHSCENMYDFNTHLVSVA